MKIIIEDPSPGEEDQIIVKCRQISPELLRALSVIKSADSLIAYDKNEIHRLNPSNVYYIESVDNKTFVYTKVKVFESRQKLYELENVLADGDFLRISKSAILNLSKVKFLAPALNGRFEAFLENGEKIIVSRQYVVQLKKKLGV